MDISTIGRQSNSTNLFNSYVWESDPNVPYSVDSLVVMPISNSPLSSTSTTFNRLRLNSGDTPVSQNLFDALHIGGEAITQIASVLQIALGPLSSIAFEAMASLRTSREAVLSTTSLTTRLDSSPLYTDLTLASSLYEMGIAVARQELDAVIALSINQPYILALVRGALLTARETFGSVQVELRHLSSYDDGPSLVLEIYANQEPDAYLESYSLFAKWLSGVGLVDDPNVYVLPLMGAMGASSRA